MSAHLSYESFAALLPGNGHALVLLDIQSLQSVLE